MTAARQLKSLSREVVITVRQGKKRLWTKKFVQGPILIGRAPEADITLDFPFFSRHHFHIEENSGHFFAVDLGSRNGFYLNGHREMRLEIIEKVTVSLEDIYFEILLLKSLPQSRVGEDGIDTVYR